MNIRIVDGRLTRDGEVKINQNGRKFLTFTLANNGFSKGAQTTTFFNVVSYNEHDIENSANFTKGKLVVVQGRPNEVMAIKDNKTYLNRNIIAYNIEPGTPNVSRENNQSEVYHDVAPVPQVQAPQMPTCEVPKVQAPTVSMENSKTTQPNKEFAFVNNVDDLPF
jgi:single-stranded DNA-binding protein